MAQRVLLLEEDATYAESLVRGLEGAGLAVTLVRDGDAGLTRAKAERFDVLLVSAELPGINGFRLFGKLKKLADFRAQVVLMGSDRTVGFDEHQKLPGRAHGYLRKPVVIAELLAMLERLATRPTTGRPPPARTGPPRPSHRPAPPASGVALAKALDRAEEQAGALNELRNKLAEQERRVAELTRAQRAAPPPLPTTSPAAREAQRKRDAELVELRAELDAERHAALDLRNLLGEREARTQALELELRELSARARRADETAPNTDVAKKAADQQRQLDALRAMSAHERTMAARTAQAFADELAALRADLDKERERADLAARAARKSGAFNETELNTTRVDLERFRAEAEAHERRIVEVEQAAAKASAELEKERAARAAAEKTAKFMRQEADVARRSRVGNEADLAAKLAASTRAAEASQRERAELESAHAKRLTSLRAVHEAERTKLLEEARALRASEDALKAELAKRADEGEERLSRAEEQYVRHMSDVSARERLHAVALADAERAQEEAKSTRVELEASRARVLELENALEDAFEAQLASRHGAEAVDDARNKMNAEVTALEQKLASSDAALRALEVAVAEANAGRERATSTEQELALRLQQAERAAKERAERSDASVRQLRAAHTAEINLLRDAHAQALAARTRALAEGLERVARETEERVTQALALQHAQALAEAREHAADEADVNHAVALAEARDAADRAMDDLRASEAARAATLTAQVSELSRALASSRQALDAERRQNLEEQVATASELETLQREFDNAKKGLTAQTGEIESLRRTVEYETTAARAALEELEKERTLIAQAKTVLSELVARIDEPSEAHDEAASRRARRR